MTDGAQHNADYIARAGVQDVAANLKTLEQVLAERERQEDRRWSERDANDDKWRTAFQKLISDLQQAHAAAASDLRFSLEQKTATADGILDKKIEVSTTDLKETIASHRKDDETAFGIINSRLWTALIALVAIFGSATIGCVVYIATRLGQH